MTERITRINSKFFDELEKIKDKRLISGKDKGRISNIKLTGLLVHHELWNKIKEDLIKATKEEIETYGK